MKILPFIVPFFLSQISFAGEADPHLCRDREIKIAGCQLAETKARLLSFCATSDRKTIFYRFGSRSNLEMEQIFTSENPLHRWVDKATYTTYLGFRVSAYSYVFGVPQETIGARAFIGVEKNQEEIMSRLCTQNSFGEKQLRSKVIREADDENIRNNNFIFPPY
jgi:hypothetical protein